MKLASKLLLLTTLSSLSSISAIAQDYPASSEGLPPSELNEEILQSAHTSAIEAYSKVLGGASNTEVSDYLSKSEQTRELSQTLEQEIPDIFGGIRVLPSKNFKAHVYLKGNKGVKDILARYSNEKYLIAKPSQHSLLDLKAAQKEILDTYIDKQTQIHTYIDIDKQDVVVVVEDVKQFRDLKKSFKTKVPLRIIQRKPNKIPATYTLGGMDSYSSDGGPCSVGIAVRKGSSYGVTTAGHCGTKSVIMKDYTGSGKSIWTDVETNYYTSYPFLDLQWHTPRNSSDSMLPYVKVTSNSFLKIKTYGTVNDGEAICSSGNTTINAIGGIVCGLVSNYNAAGFDQFGKSYENALEWDNSGQSVIRAGDSGGPLWVLRSQKDGVKIVGWNTQAEFPNADGGYKQATGQKVEDLIDKGLVVRGYP